MKTLKLAVLIFIFSNLSCSNKAEIIKNSINELNVFPKELTNIICEYLKGTKIKKGIVIEIDKELYEEMKKLEIPRMLKSMGEHCHKRDFYFKNNSIFISKKRFEEIRDPLYPDIITLNFCGIPFKVKPNHYYLINRKSGKYILNNQWDTPTTLFQFGLKVLEKSNEEIFV